MVIITKGYGDFQGIDCVEVLWKSFLGVINWQIGAAVQFHNVLHGIWAGRGMGTSYLDANLIQQTTVIREEVL